MSISWNVTLQHMSIIVLRMTRQFSIQISRSHCLSFSISICSVRLSEFVLVSTRLLFTLKRHGKTQSELIYLGLRKLKPTNFTRQLRSLAGVSSSNRPQLDQRFDSIHNCMLFGVEEDAPWAAVYSPWKGLLYPWFRVLLLHTTCIMVICVEASILCVPLWAIRSSAL